MAKAGILALTVTVLLLCRFSSGKTDLEIVQSPPFVTAVEKDPVVLQCTIKHHLSGFQMRWYRETAKSKGHFYSATPPRHRLNDGRAQLVNEDGNMVWSLKITDLKEEDSGVYYCQMYEMMETGKEELRSSGTGTHLIVEAPLTILQYPSPAVMEKNSITLTCLMGNEAPEGTVRWFRETGQGHVHFFSDKPPEYKLNDGRASWVHSGVTGDNSITVTDLSVDDSGVYYCEKYRKLNNGKEELLASGPGTKVTVEAEIVQSPASVTVNVGDSVTLLCAISGSQGFVRWMKETKQGSVRVDLAKLGHGEENSDRVHWHNNNEKWEASITIDTVKTEDSGVYYCQKYTIINPGKEQKVSSGAGTELIVKEPPALQVFQPKTQILCKKGTSVVLNCFTSPLDSSSIVTWYRNTANGEKAFISSKVPGEDDETDPRINFTKQQQDKVDWSITIEKLKVKDSGEYYCEVSDTRQTITSVAVKLSVTGDGQDDEEEEVENPPTASPSPLPYCHRYDVPWEFCEYGPSDSGRKILSESLIEFAFYLYKMKAAEKPDANVVFSPFSIASTLSLLLLGARGESRRDLEKELRYPENFSCIHEEMRHVAKTSLNLLTASKIFHRADIEMQPFFINQSQEFYGVLPEQLTNESSVNTEMINQWVSEKTQHKITTLVDNVGLDTDIIILNAIYYQGTWLTQFDPENTTMDSFRSPDKTVQVQMMKSENYKLFIKNDFHLKAKVAKFQLSGRTSLLVLLPFDSTPNSLVDLESKLELDTFLKLMRDLNAAELTDAMVALPKIILDTKTDLTWLLGDMMNFMHSYKSPNLCGMTPQNPLLISDSQHRAVIELSESGVEAAAATSVSVARTINVFEANHPFIFILWDEKNEVPLIMGQVVDPTSTS